MINYEKLGWIENPKDERDWTLGMVQPPASNILATYKPAEFFSLAALMQDQQPACGGFSLAQLLQYYIYLRTGSPVDLSPRFAYMAEKSLDGLPTIEGTTLRGIGQAITKLGICLNTLLDADTNLPDTTYQDLTQASTEAKTDALTRIEPSYFFLDDLSWGGIQQAIYQNKAVILELKVGSEWWTSKTGTNSWAATDILPLRPPASTVSGHFIMAGAYDQDNIWLLNSWSQQWAQNGFANLQKDYLPDIIGGLAVVDIPKSVKTALSNKQVDLADQILEDMKQVLSLISKEVS
ncbi:MAG: hypothetical protein ACRDF4_11580 [Rhabdochlamydiaceae bacterium]